MFCVFICYYKRMENFELERRKIVAENIKKLIKEKGITQKQLAKEIGMSQNIITEYVKLRSFPPGGVLQKIADYFGVKKSDIDTTWKIDVNSENTPFINKTIDNMKKLSESRQEAVMNFSKMQLDEQNARARRNIKIEIIKNPQNDEEPVKLYPVKAKEHVALAAGLGFSYNDTGEYATYYTMRNDLACFDEAVPVDGESMEPLVHDGDIALIKTNYTKADGCIYAFDYDGKSYIKYLYFYDDKIVVKSENKDKFDDWEIRFDDLAYDSFLYFKIVGEVVDWFTPEVV